jgi:starch-binding outer membrane protein, SusD/RagB family
METKFNTNVSRVLLLLAAFLVFSCSLDLAVKEPNLIPPASADGAPTPGTLDKVYQQLNNLVGQANWFAMCEHTTDELMGPTRGTDWDDFGTWRKLHLHTWDGSHNQVNDTWNQINGALYQTTLLAETASGQTAAEAKFLRAYFSYICADLYGQVQHRPATAKVLDLPSVYTRAEATDFIISELESIIPSLPTFSGGNRYMATKAAAQFLLAKTYLNKAVFKQDPKNPSGPFTFDATDMNKVIANVDAAASQGGLTIATNYWDNFTWDNGTKSTENIFARKNSDGINVVWATCMGGHYNMVPSGWNGFTTLSDFYNSFESADARRSAAIPGYSTQVGRNAGFLVGQIKGPDKVGDKREVGNAIVDLKDRSGNPLIFTSDASLYFSTETKGIRTNKYPLDPTEINGGGWGSKNDFVFFRLADLKLMKAEAILRGGAATSGETPVIIVNAIRANRAVSNLASVDLTALLAERGRELYLEAWRRNDLIRFEKFNDPVVERNSKSDPTRVIFPIPNIALSSNPNLKQNFGY